MAKTNLTNMEDRADAVFKSVKTLRDFSEATCKHKATGRLNKILDLIQFIQTGTISGYADKVLYCGDQIE